MSDNQLIITLIGIAVLLLIAFAVAILLRKRNERREKRRTIQPSC